MNSRQLMKQTKLLFTLDNIVGLILAILIFFDFKVENDFKDVLNSPPGMILALVLLVVIFIFMNPIVGLLYLIYIYECVKDTALHPSKFNGSSIMKQNILNQLNNNPERKREDSVDYEIINKMAPIVKKRENTNSIFVPHINDNISFEKL